MKIFRVGDVLHLARRPVSIDPFTAYQEIGIRSFGKGIFHKEPVQGAELGNKRVFEIRAGDLIFSNVFAWEGAVALASPQDDGLIGSHRFMTHLVDGEVADPRYLLYFFMTERGVTLLGQASPGSAGRNRTLAIERLAELRVPLPHKVEQQRVVEKLDACLELTSRAEKLLDRRLELVRICRGSLTIAGSRRAVLMGDILQRVERTVTVEPTVDYEMVGVRSFAGGCFDAGILSGSATRYPYLLRVEGGDLIYPKLMAWEGAFAVVPPELSGRYVSPEFCAFRSKEGVAIDFVEAYLSLPATWAIMSGRSLGTNLRRRRLRPEEFLSRSMPLPEPQEQARLLSVIRALSAIPRASHNLRVRLDAMKTGILNRELIGAS